MRAILALLFVLIGGSAWGQQAWPPPGVPISGPVSTNTVTAINASGVSATDTLANRFNGVTNSAGNWTFGNGITIAPVANSLNPAINTIQSGAGTPVSFPPSAAHAGYAFNLFNITSDTVNALAGPSGSQNAIGLDVPMVIGTGATGNHIGMFGGVTIGSTPTTAGSYVGIWGFAEADVNLGGVSGTPAGYLYGSNPQVNVEPSATYLIAAVGEEVDVYTGAAPLARFGTNVVALGVSPAQGSTYDAAFAVGGGTTWRYGFQLTDYNGGTFPLAPTGTILGSTKSGTVAYGIDLGNITCSNYCYRSPGFQDNGAGGVTDYSPTSNASVTISSDTADTSYVNFQVLGAEKWFIGNNGSNQFIGWDQTNSAPFLLVTSTGNATIGEGGSSTVEINGALRSGSTAAVSCAAGTVSLTTLTVTNGIVTHC